MANENQNIIGAGQDNGGIVPPEDEEKCTDTKCYYYGIGQGCMTSGPCVYCDPESETEGLYGI